MTLPKESATFSSCRFNFFRAVLIPNSRYKAKIMLPHSPTNKIFFVTLHSIHSCAIELAQWVIKKVLLKFYLRYSNFATLITA